MGNATIALDFLMFQHYIPPNSGNGSEDVALAAQAWSWDADVTFNSATGISSLNSGPHAQKNGSKLEEPSMQFKWTANIADY
jgi:hypothetical protein